MSELDADHIKHAIRILTDTQVKEGDMILYHDGRSVMITGMGLRREQIEKYLKLCRKDYDSGREYLIPENVRNYVVDNAGNNLDAIDLLEKYGFLQS